MSRLIPLKRGAGIRALCVGAVVISISAIGSIDHAERYMVGDLQLISWKSVPEANASWSGPVEAATLLAWFASHGHDWILPDFNEDGFIDEDDTADLASMLGRVFMETEAVSGTTDPALVWGIGAYLAEMAPGRFGMRVYDLGFADEWQDNPPGPFRLDEIPGVSVELWDNPSLNDYRAEMAVGALTILGLNRVDEQHNVYVAGRSLGDEPEGAAVAGIGFVSSSDDLCRAGAQGRIVDTISKSTTGWLVRVDGLWYEIEFMLALWATEADASSFAAAAPDLVADVVSTSSCEDSTQEDGIACTIQWKTTISNNNPDYRVPRAFKVEQRIDLPSKSPGNQQTQYFPKFVEGALLRELNETGSVALEGSFTWLTGSAGISDEEYEILVLADARCEVDEYSPLAEENNGAVARGAITRETSEDDPGKGLSDEGRRVIVPMGNDDSPPTEEGCPDLSVEIVDTSCEWESGFHTLDYDYIIEVTVKVSNLGESAAGTFWVRLSGANGSDVKVVFGLAAGEATTVTLGYEYTVDMFGEDVMNMQAQAEPVGVQVHAIEFEECTISNNRSSGEVCD